MKNADKDITKNLPKSDGMTVPEGYFEDFNMRMSAMLPERPELEHPGEHIQKKSLWMQIRPYVYMAAMFAGVWLMLKMFTSIAVTEPVSFDSDPIVAEALSNDDFVNEYVISDMNQWDLYDDLLEDGINPDTFLDSIAFMQMDLPLEAYQSDF